MESLESENTVLPLSKVRDKFLEDRKTNAITEEEESQSKLKKNDKAKIEKLLKIFKDYYL